MTFDTKELAEGIVDTIFIRNKALEEFKNEDTYSIPLYIGKSELISLVKAVLDYKLKLMFFGE